MVDINKFLEGSNAIEDVHSEQALSDSLDAWDYLRQQRELIHNVLKRAHYHVVKNRQPRDCRPISRHECAGRWTTAAVTGVRQDCDDRTAGVATL